MGKCAACGMWVFECEVCARSLGNHGGPEDLAVKIVCVKEEGGPKHFCSGLCWTEYRKCKEKI